MRMADAPEVDTEGVPVPTTSIGVVQAFDVVVALVDDIVVRDLSDR